MARLDEAQVQQLLAPRPPARKFSPLLLNAIAQYERRNA